MEKYLVFLLEQFGDNLIWYDPEERRQHPKVAFFCHYVKYIIVFLITTQSPFDIACEYLINLIYITQANLLQQLDCLSVLVIVTFWF